MEVSWWYCWVTVISLVTNFHGCLGWPTLQPPLRPVTSKHELDSDESRKVLGSSVVTSVSVIMDHGNGTKTFLSDGMENPELKTNIIGSPGNLLNPDKYEFYTFDETGDLVKRLMTWDEIQGLIAGGEGESLLGEASMPMYYSDTLPDKMGSTHITANDFQTSDIQGVHKVVESVQNVLKSELAASQNKIPPVAKPPFIANTPNWSLFLPSILDNAEDGSELNNLPGMLVSPSALHTSLTTGDKSNLTALSGTTEVTSSDTNGTEIPTTTAAFTEITTTPFKEYTKKAEKPIRYKTTTTKPATPIKSTFTSSPSKTPNRPTGDTSIPTSTYSATPFKKYSTTKYGGYSSTDHWFSTSTLLPSTSKKNDYWYSTSSLVPTSSKKNDFWYSTTSTEPTSSKKIETWFSTTNASPTSPKKTFTSSKYGGYLANDEYTSTGNPFITRKPPPPFNKFGESLTTDEYGWPIATTESTSTSRKALTTSKYGGYSTNNELFASIANVLHQVTDNAKPSGAPVTSSNPTLANKPTTQQYKVSTEANRFTTFNKFQYRPSTELNIPATSIENKTAFTTESTRSTAVPEIFKTSSTLPQKFSAEPTRFTITLENHRPLHTLSHKFTTENSKFTEKNNPFQHKFSTESYIPLENHKTVSPFHKFTTSTSNKYFTPDSLKTVSSTSQRISTEPTRYTPQNIFKTTSYHSTESIISEVPASTTHSEATSINSISSETSSEAGTSGGLNNYTPLSMSTIKQNDTFKTTKTSSSSTALPMAHVTLQKQPLTMKPSKPTKSSITKGTIRPSAYTSSLSVTRPYNTIATSTATEKPLVRISTFSSTVAESTTNHPETLVTWISTFPLEETPSKVALNGVFDSDKLVTEQYVSSYHNKQPTIEDFFRNVTTASTIKESTPSSTTTNASTTENYPTVLPYSSSPPSSSSSYTKFGLHLTTLSHSSGSTHTSIKNNITTAASPTFEPAHLFRTSERPFYTIESKTEPINLSTMPQRYSTPSHHIIHTVPTEYTEIRVIKTTLKPATIPALSTSNYSSSETVMQRVPTINPPSKIHSNNNNTGGPKSSTRPQFLSTESTKNITQIAVMLNKSNDTSLRLDLQQRTKVTSRPIFETTKPIDCITSTMPNNTSDNTRLSASPYTTSSPVASSQKENSHIYYYKLPAITSSPQHELHIYHHKATSTSTTTETISNASVPPALNRKPEPVTTLKSSTEKEYQKITTVNHPSSDIIQNGISAVTNILLQTEGRIPNKDFVESDTVNNTSSSTASILTGINSSTPSRLITEAMLRTESLQSQTRSATTNSSTNYTTLSTTPVSSSKPENHTNPTTPYIPSTTINILESTSTSIKPSSTTSSSTTTSTTNPASTIITKIATNYSTTAEIISSTDPSSEFTVAPTTTFSSDLRNDFILNDQNITREEEEDIKNYHSQILSSANRSGNVIKNNTSPLTTPPTSTLARTEPPKLKTTSAVRPSTNIATKNTSSSNRNTTITSTTTSTTPTLTTTTLTPTNSTTSSTTPSVGIKIENAVKADNKSDHSADAPPPPSAFRSPLNPTSKVPASGSTGNGVELHPAPHESMGLEASVAYLGDDVKRFIDFCNELSFKIWTSQTGKSLVTSRSIVLSPFAVLSTLAMIFLGARGSSSGIMNDFLRLDDMVTFNPHQVVQNITESVVNTKNIGVANAAFVREIFSDKNKGKVLDFYKERLQQYYDTHVEEITFNIIGDLVRRRTNLLVKRQTQGKIQDYLRGSALLLKPPLAVLTANIFQTDCDIASTEGRDGEMYFVVRPSTRQRRLVPIPAVVYRSGFLAGYEPGLDATAVTLNPESAVSTILVLPGQQGQVAPGDGLARLEQRLLESSYRRGAWSRLLRSLLFRPGLELQIPRFSHKSVLNLTAGLQKMGMADIFAADKADLRGINGVSNELHLSDIVQVNTFSTCGEETVDARHHIETYPSSPQRVGRHGDIFDHTFLDDSVNNYYSSLPLNLRPRQARLPDNPRLRFDRPFLYIVRHNPTGLILYIGRFNPRLLP